jgi:hypothetical protein
MVIYEIYLYITMGYKRDIYVLYFYRRWASWRVCYKLQSRNIALIIYESIFISHLINYELWNGVECQISNQIALSIRYILISPEWKDQNGILNFFCHVVVSVVLV